MQSIPDRVLGLIEATGLSRHAFAVRIGLDDSKLSKSLSGTRRFSSLDLARIAELCQVTVDWLITGEDTPLAVAARTTGGDAGTALEAAKRYGTLRSDMTSLGYPQPWRPVTAELGTGTYAEQGKRLAEAALARVSHAGRSIPDSDLAGLIEDVFGADVAVVELGTGFDGLAASSEGGKLIVVATADLPPRQLFTLAHELGHLLAGDDQEVHLDKDVYASGPARDPSEQRANAFASAFLMPKSTLSDLLGATHLTRETFAALACKLMVTPSALAYRLQRLRLIDSGTRDQYKSITGKQAAHMAGQGHAFSQRITQARTPRPPGLLARDTYAAYESGKATLRPYAGLIGADADDLARALEPEPETHDAP